MRNPTKITYEYIFYRIELKKENYIYQIQIHYFDNFIVSYMTLLFDIVDNNTNLNVICLSIDGIISHCNPCTFEHVKMMQLLLLLLFNVVNKSGSKFIHIYLFRIYIYIYIIILDMGLISNFVWGKVHKMGSVWFF